jgi:hypothetical protein
MHARVAAAVTALRALHRTSDEMLTVTAPLFAPASGDNSGPGGGPLMAV